MTFAYSYITSPDGAYQVGLAKSIVIDDVEVVKDNMITEAGIAAGWKRVNYNWQATKTNKD